MIKRLFVLFLLAALFAPSAFAQFGQNKVQYKDYTWYYIQTRHFDIYFSQEGSRITEFAAKAAEDALASIEEKLNFRINNRITIILYNSQNDFQETNVTDEYLTEGIGGFTELFKNRVVVPFTGNYKAFRHVIHHELVHAVINDLFYGGSVQNLISNNITIRVPLWFNEGLAEYLSLGWDTNTDMFIRDAATSEYLPDINNLGGYFAYRGGQSVFNYLAKKYGEEKIGELVNKIKSKGSFEEGMKATLGLTIEELNERWRKDVKREFWPDIKDFKDPDEFSKRLTDHRKDGGFYNTSPAISPQGDRIAFISNRDYFFDVYLMDASEGKIIKRLVKGSRTADFEELNILTPGLSWSPDGKKIALSAKSNGYDVIHIIEVEEEDVTTLPLKFAGITGVHWSPDGKQIAFAGHTAAQSDIYIYSFDNNSVVNITNDIFSDLDAAWSTDGKVLYFVSDRGLYTNVPEGEPIRMYDHDYKQNDIYSIELASGKISRITDMSYSDESSPLVSPDGKSLLFISDMNGINNIYKVGLAARDSVIGSTAPKKIEPVTNSLNPIYQLSASVDGKKLVFSSMYQAAFNIFLMTNPFETKAGPDTLKLTNYMSRLLNPGTERSGGENGASEKADSSQNGRTAMFTTGTVMDTSAGRSDSGSVSYSKYIFGESSYYKAQEADSTDKLLVEDNLDQSGNYRVNRYKITFSPDIVYANAGFSSLYGLLGTTVISFSDMLGNHRLIGQTSLQIDLKNSDYGLAYFYLPQRLDLGIQGFHTARFLIFEKAGRGQELYRFRNYGVATSFSYPINRFYRFEGGLNYLNVSTENLEDPNYPIQKVGFFVPSLAFVKDNTIFGYTAPIEGIRYRFEAFGNVDFKPTQYGFYSLLGDYRHYLRFWGDYSFAFRFSGGYSGGKNPQRFFLGGIDNWINRRFATQDLPIETPSDFAFLTGVYPLRGFDYAQKIGTRFGLMNLEFRYPLIRYLVTGAIPILFRDVQGVAFFDAGTAWTRNTVSQFFAKDAYGNTVAKDLLFGTGVGARFYFLYFLLRFDMAWPYVGNSFSKPVFYFSLGADF